MKKQDLDALASLYESVYSSTENGEYLVEGLYDAANVRRSQQAQQGRDTFKNLGGYAGLSQAATAAGDTAGAKKYMQKSQQIGDAQKSAANRASANAAAQASQRRQQEISQYRQAMGGTTSSQTFQNTGGYGRYGSPSSQVKTSTTPARPAGSPPARPAGSPPPAAKPSGVVLARKNNVTGTLDKSTGKFTEKNWNDAETQRYQARAAQNAARTSASSGGSPSSSSSSSTSATSAPKTPTPAIGKLGNTSFERRTPTSAELRAAQGERERQKTAGEKPNAEKALQAAKIAGAGAAAASKQTTNQTTTAFSSSTPPLTGINNIKPSKPPTPGTGATMKQSYEWPSAKTIRDIADAYSSIYEAKKKVDQDQDGDNDFADVRIARMVASGVPKEVAIARVRNKSYNEEVELDEATRMRKELGVQGEIATRKELARRSNAYQRSGSVDKTIAAAERAADRTTPRRRNESPDEFKQRMQQRSRTLRGLASSRRGSVRDKPRAGMRGYAAKVEGPDKELQTARQRAMSAGTLTPKEKKQLGEEYQIYEIVASYLLENNFAETLDDANVIIENMSEVWLEEILNNN